MGAGATAGIAPSRLLFSARLSEFKIIVLHMGSSIFSTISIDGPFTRYSSKRSLRRRVFLSLRVHWCVTTDDVRLLM